MITICKKKKSKNKEEDDKQMNLIRKYLVFYDYYLDRRIRIEQKKQDYFHNQKKLIQVYHDRKLETENLLGISDQK